MRNWIEENSLYIKKIKDVERDANRWNENGQSPAYLIIKQRLDEIDEILANTNYLINRATVSFIEASKKENLRQQLHDSIINGNTSGVDSLLKKLIVLKKPLLNDFISPFYDAIWGDEEPDIFIRNDGLGSESKSLNKKSATRRNSRGQTPLHFASVAGRVDKIRMIVSGLGISPNQLSDNGSTPLAFAAYSGHFEAVKLLVQLGADSTIRDIENQMSPLDWATNKGYNKIVNYLIKLQIGENDQLPLELARGLIISASVGGHLDQLKQYLGQLKSGKDKLAIVQEALIYSTFGNLDVELLSVLIENGANPIEKFTVKGPKKDSTPLHNLAVQGNFQALKFLIEKTGIEKQIDVIDSEGRTLLVQSILYANINVVNLLLDNGADINIQDNENNTALHFAVLKNETQVIDIILMDERVNIDAVNIQMVSPFLLAAKNGFSNTMQKLLRNGASYSVYDVDGNDALILAAYFGHEEVVNLLINLDINRLKWFNKIGQNALMLAARKGHYPVVKMICDKTNDLSLNLINHFDKQGFSALNHSIEGGNVLVTKLLMNAKNLIQLPIWSETIVLNDNSIKLRMIEKETRENLPDKSKIDWSIPPLVGSIDTWYKITGHEFEVYTNQLLDSLKESERWINSDQIYAIRAKKLSFYPSGELIECLTNSIDGYPGLITFVSHSSRVYILDGTSPPILMMNNLESIVLDSSEKALEYLILFCNSVQGDNGPFSIISSYTELSSVNGPSDFSSIEFLFDQPEIIPSEEESFTWKVTATVLYSQIPFRVKFTIFENGMIEMVEEKQLLEILIESKIWGFWGLLRGDRTDYFTKFEVLQ